MGAGAHECLGGKCAVALAEQAPRPTVNEHMNRRVGLRASVEIERLRSRRPIGEYIRLAEPRTDAVAVLGVAADNLDGVWRPGSLIILAIKLRLIVVEKDHVLC